MWLYRKSEKDRSDEFRRKLSQRITALINTAQRTSDSLALCQGERERGGNESARKSELLRTWSERASCHELLLLLTYRERLKSEEGEENRGETT